MPVKYKMTFNTKYFTFFTRIKQASLLAIELQFKG